MNILPPLPSYPDLSRDEREAIVLPNYRDGASAGQIALMFHGASRNAIIGVIQRASEGGRIEKRERLIYETVVRPKVAKVRAKKVARMKAIISELSQPDIEPVIDWRATTAWDALPGTTPVTLADIDKGQCKWPLTGRMFCGAPAGDRSYCEAHHVRAYKPHVASGKTIRIDGHAKRVGI